MDKLVEEIRRHPVVIGLTFYVAVGILTFGYAAANRECDEDHWQSCSEQSVWAGFGGAGLWPLYWSWEVQAGHTKEVTVQDCAPYIWYYNREMYKRYNQHIERLNPPTD